MSDFWARKMKTYFRRIDFDNDGCVTRADFVAMGQMFAESGMLDQVKADRLKKALTDVDDNTDSARLGLRPREQRAWLSGRWEYPSRRRQIWDVHLKVASNNKESLNESAFVDVMKKVALSTNSTEALKGPLPLYFVAVDSNQDGNIEIEEYEIFFNTLGMDKTLASAAFKDIDENNDGVINEEEFVEAGIKFFTCQNEDGRAQMFWGKVVD